MMMTPEGEQNPNEAFAQGKMLQDIARERGQRNYQELEKQIRENGEKWLKEEAEMMEKAQKEAMTSCLVCRSRKVKCDRTTPSCLACRRLRISCPGYESRGPVSATNLDSSVEGIFRASGVQRRKVGSCESCYKAKIRCSKSRPSCHRCAQRGTACVYPGKYKPVIVEDPSSTETSRAPVQPLPSVNSHDGFDAPINSLGEISATQDELGQDELKWLYAESPPVDPALQRILFDRYFTRIHTLRCLGFLHRPSFMQSFDSGTLHKEYGTPLIQMISAFGASCLYFENPRLRRYTSHLGMPGGRWAAKAADAVLQGIRKPSAMVLVCEYGIGTEDHGMVFQLMGCCHRLVRLLGIDEQKTSSFGCSAQAQTRIESERRLAWSCYILDNVVGAGVDANMAWPRCPAMPLPIADHEFTSQVVPTGEELPTVHSFDSAALPRKHNLRSHIIFLVSLRTQVLRLIRESRTPESISRQGSDFLELISKLDTWHANLPQELQLTQLQLYAHKDTNTIGAIFFLHLGYHGAISDLTRISLKGFDFPLAEAFQSLPAPFRAECQRRCRYHADKTSEIIRLGLEHGTQPFDDPFCHVAAFEATKIQIVHSATAPNDAGSRGLVEDNIRTNIRLMELKEALPQGILVLSVFAGNDITGPADVAYLTSLSTFRRAKARAKATEQQPSTTEEQARALGSRDAASERQPPFISGVGPPATQISGLYEPSIQPLLPHHDNAGLGMIGHHSAAPDISPSTMGSDRSWFPPDEYLQLATEMSDYLTWEIGGLAEWPDIHDHQI
ncbi:hypothetical protein NM208_g11057 [Fusarium decemcellulare]|uniref:Uncharacterized protein n=1 Tax=Fusarium decemcellulare TaxID=57161 RepID=A0ACC1RVQ1_9HYPO|nr:hypothetical protein NM208_g11057 [Fusarium decemcellulare]